MNQPRTEEHGERSVFTCMLWNVQSGRPTVVTILDEHPDRWIGRRCVIGASSFEAPLEMFMKSEWRRGEAPAQEKPEDQVQPVIPTPSPAPGGRNRSHRGFHP
jgi:hypothetical protein